MNVPRLQVVTGKGGVGKSTFTAALALAAHRAGLRVLAIEMGAPAGVAGLLGVRPAEHGVPVRVRDGFSLAYYDGEASLAEFLLKRLPFKSMISGLFTHPLYRAFVAAGPGVRELMAIGKVQDEVLGISAGAPQWDTIVLDAGASGHALQLLGMPAATARTFGSGLAHREATRVAKLLADPGATAVHVVALPEEMPLEEAGEVIEKLRALALPVGRVVINQCRPTPPAGVEAAVAGLRGAEGDPAKESLALAAARALGWLDLQERGIARLEARVGKRVERLPLLVAEPFGLAEVERLSEVAS